MVWGWEREETTITTIETSIIETTTEIKEMETPNLGNVVKAQITDKEANRIKEADKKTEEEEDKAEALEWIETKRGDKEDKEMFKEETEEIIMLIKAIIE